jgi:DNA-binding response OmpR family regulator
MTVPPPAILFADRNLSWSRAIRSELRRRGAKVVMATTVDEALHQAATFPPDLLILDDDLDGKEDRDLAELFQSALPDAKMILLESKPRASAPHPGGPLFCSGPRPLAPETLLSLAIGAIGHRLREAPSPRKGKVLCVDDDPKFLKSMSRMLGRRGYTVLAFESAERALDAIPSAKPDLALVDIMMPGEGGLELAEKIRETSNDAIPVVFLTALGSDEAYYEGHRHGGRYLVEKTGEPQKLFDVVDYLAGDLDPVERELLREKL